jgi:hypothetical protein
MKPLHPSTVAASRQSVANLRALKNAAFCLPRRCAGTAGRKSPRILCGLALAFVLHFGVLACSAQTYTYTYTGNDFTSVFNAANELRYGILPYTTSDQITGSITFSAPLGDNYEGNPSATLLNFIFTDGVGPQNIGGTQAVFPYVGAFTFGTDSSGDIVSWNFQTIVFLNSIPETRGIQTENEPGNVVDSGNIDQPSGIVGNGSVTSDPGVWVLTAVPEPSIGALFVSFTALALAFGRFKPFAAPSTLRKGGASAGKMSSTVPVPVHNSFSGSSTENEL